MKYLITICKAQKKHYVEEAELRSIKTFLESKKVYFKDYVFECHGLYRQLHCHAIVKFYGRWSLFTNHAGFRIYWSKILNEPGAISYLKKFASNRYRQEQILTENQYNLYRFNDVVAASAETISV